MIMSMTTELDISVIQAFMKSVILYPVDSYVTLSSGEVAKVVENTPNYPLRPKVVGLKSGKLFDLSNDSGVANQIITT